MREYLRRPDYADGLTTNQLAALAGSDRVVVNESLHKMPDAYIDRWVKERTGPGRYAAVWCVVVPPPHCPPPSNG